MTALLERMTAHNPLLAHGPRSHGTGIALAPSVSVQKQPTWWRAIFADTDAPRIHLGPGHH